MKVTVFENHQWMKISGPLAVIIEIFSADVREYYRDLQCIMNGILNGRTEVFIAKVVIIPIFEIFLCLQDKDLKRGLNSPKCI